MYLNTLILQIHLQAPETLLSRCLATDNLAFSAQSSFVSMILERNYRKPFHLLFLHQPFHPDTVFDETPISLGKTRDSIWFRSLVKKPMELLTFSRMLCSVRYFNPAAAESLKLLLPYMENKSTD